MKTFSYTIIAFIVFLGLVWWNTSYLTKSSKQLSNGAENIWKIVSDEKWDEADIEILQVRRMWGQHKKTWLLLLDHDDIDNIDITLYRLDEMIKNRQKEEALSDIAELRFYVQDIADKEALSLVNIF